MHTGNLEPKHLARAEKKELKGKIMIMSSGGGSGTSGNSGGGGSSSSGGSSGAEGCSPSGRVKPSGARRRRPPRPGGVRSEFDGGSAGGEGESGAAPSGDRRPPARTLTAARAPLPGPPGDRRPRRHRSSRGCPLARPGAQATPGGGRPHPPPPLSGNSCSLVSGFLALFPHQVPVPLWGSLFTSDSG